MSVLSPTAAFDDDRHPRWIKCPICNDGEDADTCANCSGDGEVCSLCGEASGYCCCVSSWYEDDDDDLDSDFYDDEDDD